MNQCEKYIYEHPDYSCQSLWDAATEYARNRLMVTSLRNGDSSLWSVDEDCRIDGVHQIINEEGHTICFMGTTSDFNEWALENAMQIVETHNALVMFAVEESHEMHMG
jgi:hypothetical protein